MMSCLRIYNNVAEALMIEMAGVGPEGIDAANMAMEQELKEKQRLAEEEAARKKKEAEAPSLVDISADGLLGYIEPIRFMRMKSDWIFSIGCIDALLVATARLWEERQTDYKIRPMYSIYSQI